METPAIVAETRLAQTRWTIVASVLTGAAFLVLHSLHLVGKLPLGSLIAIFVIGAVASTFAGVRWGKDPTPARLHGLLAVQILASTAIIYAIGWGPSLALGYPFVIASDLDTIGSRVWRPALFWVTASMLAGQVAIALGLFSYVATPEVHGLAALSLLGVSFIVYVLGTKTETEETAAADLRRSETRFRQLFADNPQPMFAYDDNTLAFVEMNDAAVVKFGYTRDEFLSMRLPDLTTDGNLNRYALKGGVCIDVDVEAHKVTLDDRRVVLASVQDVTERNRLEAALRHQAFHDELTGLANRALLTDRIDHAIHRLRRTRHTAAVLVLDLDRFKTVNDSLGHNAGDALLREIAARFRRALREADTPARIGGDEFAILLEDLDSVDDAKSTAQRLLDALEEPFVVLGKEIFARASIGVSIVDTHGDNADELLRNADAAMYRAKEHGGEYRVFETKMHENALTRLELESDLRRALTERQLVLHYQPIVSLSSQRVVGVEALVRWDHPDRGLIAPNDFIPLAEQNGLIVDLGRWVLLEACAQAQAWRAVWDKDLGVTVNVSRRQLIDPDIYADVANALRASRLDPDALTLEITESCLIDDPALVLERLQQLKTLNVKIAIDDFGTGYSTLSSVHTWPIDTLKIDKSFVDGVTAGSTAVSVVQAIVSLAQTMELETVAEGVEQTSQLERLADLGCSHMQGFCFSKPLPAADVAKLFEGAPHVGT
jgi:diguanylate cyclase (GGDEF)-like protein